MKIVIEKNILTQFTIGFLLLFLPTIAWTALSVHSKVVSGIIIRKDTNQVIELDNGKVYYPSRTSLAVELPVNSPVTLRYYTENENKNVYFEFRSGLNTLPALQPLPATKNKTPHY